MRAFEVYLNDQKLYLAGVGDDGVLTTIVNWVAKNGRATCFSLWVDFFLRSASTSTG